MNTKYYKYIVCRVLPSPFLPNIQAEQLVERGKKVTVVEAGAHVLSAIDGDMSGGVERELVVLLLCVVYTGLHALRYKHALFLHCNKYQAHGVVLRLGRALKSIDRLPNSERYFTMVRE